MKRRGFTLVEILVSMTLFVILAVSVTALVASLLRSARKAAVLGIAKTEGEYALMAMAEMVRYAGEVVCSAADAGGQTLEVTKQNGDIINYRYYLTPLPRISSESGALATPLNSSRVTLTACSGTTAFTCPDPQTVDICFWADVPGGLDVSEKVGVSSGIQFQTKVVLRNKD